MAKDILDEMTKEELVYWIRSHFFHRLPKRSEILFLRWDISNKKNLEEQRIHSDKLSSLGGKEYDKHAAAFNKSTDPKEQLSLIKKMKVYQDKWKNWMQENDRLEKEYDEIELLYKSIEIERQKEK